MQNAFLISSKYYSEKQAGIMFFVFGMSQFLFQTPAGYLMDSSDKKVAILGGAAIGTTLFTILTACFAQEYAGNFLWMVFVKFLQGAATSFISPGLNSITQGIVGSVGMTGQVSKNEMMNHLGTTVMVLIGSLIGFARYPNIGLLFIVSPIACLGVIYHLMKIQPGDIDHDAARGLKSASSTNRTTSALTSQDGIVSTEGNHNVADSPLQVLRDPTLMVFIIICFTFHLSNGTVLPLVMQTLALGGGRQGILLSGLCIIIAQIFMVVSASICGKYSGIFGRKGIFLAGLFIVPIRCALITFLVTLKAQNEGSLILDILLLSTQVLDGVGAGIWGTMYVLVTSDISGGTGRFSMTLGMTTAAMSIGGTVSGYLGQAMAQDIGYRQAFIILGFMALFPASLYFFFMPETLSKEEKANVDISNDIVDESQDNIVSPFGQMT